MTTYFQQGNNIRVAPDGSMNLSETLHPRCYTVVRDEFGNFYLTTVDGFTVPNKMYGKTGVHANRILHTFADRKSSTGVLLSGEKGSGKTLLAKLLCVKGIEQGYPVIVVNTPYYGDEFNSFIQSISQPTIILFDEFEKVYDREQQEKMLTLLDGVYQSRKLFILTCNDKWRLDRNMANRPGRLYYMIEFSGLDSAFIQEYCQDNLKYPEYIDSVCKTAMVFDAFNFDMLQTMVEEINRYKCTAQEAIELLNIKPEFSDGGEFVYDVYLGDHKVAAEQPWHGNPIQQHIVLWLGKNDIKTTPEFLAIPSDSELVKSDEEIDDEDNDRRIDLFSTDIVRVDAKSGVFVFQSKRGERVEFKRAQKYSFNYNAL